MQTPNNSLPFNVVLQEKNVIIITPEPVEDQHISASYQRTKGMIFVPNKPKTIAVSFKKQKQTKEKSIPVSPKIVTSIKSSKRFKARKR